MKIFIDNLSLEKFDAWSGAVDTKDTIIANNKESEFEALITELYPDGLEDVTLNDILWHESDWVYTQLGISDEEE